MLIDALRETALTFEPFANEEYGADVDEYRCATLTLRVWDGSTFWS